MKKKNILFIILCLIICLLVVFIFYQNSKKESVNIGFSEKEKCANLAKDFLQHEKEVDSFANVLNEKYTFNSSLNTCLVYFEVAETGAGTAYNIIDLLTNKKLYTHIDYVDSSLQKNWDENCKSLNEGCVINKDDFVNKQKELFK
jgi:hypothetical protein